MFIVARVACYSRFREGSEIKNFCAGLRVIFLKGFNVKHITDEYGSVIYLLLLGSDGRNLLLKWKKLAVVGLKWKERWKKIKEGAQQACKYIIETNNGLFFS